MLTLRVLRAFWTLSSSPKCSPSAQGSAWPTTRLRFHLRSCLTRSIIHACAEGAGMASLQTNSSVTWVLGGCAQDRQLLGGVSSFEEFVKIPFLHTWWVGRVVLYRKDITVLLTLQPAGTQPNVGGLQTWKVFEVSYLIKKKKSYNSAFCSLTHSFVLIKKKSCCFPP